MPLVLPYCLGDVVGEVFGYRSRGVVVLDVGAPCNGTCRGKKTKDVFPETYRNNTDSWGHYIISTLMTHRGKTEWNVKITLLHSVIIQPERLYLQLLIKYPDKWQITLLP